VTVESVAANGNGAPTPIRREQPVQPPPITPEPLAQPPHPPQSSGASASAQEAFSKARNQWDLVKRACKQKSVSVQGLLQAANPVLVEPTDPVTIVISVDFPIHLGKLSQPQGRKITEWALGEIIGIPCQVRFIHKGEAEAFAQMMPPSPAEPTPAPDDNAAPPAPIAPPAEQAQPLSTPTAPIPVSPPPDPRAEAESDPVVRELRREFGARVTDIRQADG